MGGISREGLGGDGGGTVPGEQLEVGEERGAHEEPLAHRRQRDDQHLTDITGRVTFQINHNNKVTVHYDKGIKWRGNVNASQVQELQFSQNVSQVFFGINMKCASCHDSFIDRWKLDEWLALYTLDCRYEISPTGKADAAELSPETSLFLVADNRFRLEQRVIRLNKPTAHAEYPHSKVRHIVSNSHNSMHRPY